MIKICFKFVVRVVGSYLYNILGGGSSMCRFFEVGFEGARVLRVSKG